MLNTLLKRPDVGWIQIHFLKKNSVLVPSIGRTGFGPSPTGGTWIGFDEENLKVLRMWKHGRGQHQKKWMIDEENGKKRRDGRQREAKLIRHPACLLRPRKYMPLRCCTRHIQHRNKSLEMIAILSDLKSMPASRDYFGGNDWI